jgi:TRAP-type mannitol/chloroaromatic compound transport system permease small subunit
MFLKLIDSASEVTGRIISWLVIVLTLVLGYEIAARYLFGAPTKWAFDLSYMIGGTFFLMGEAYTLKHRQHVRIDIFYSRFSPRIRAGIDVVFFLLLFFPLWGGILYALFPYVAFSWEMGEKSMQGYWQPVLYPFKTVMPIGVGLLLLQGIAEFWRSLAILIKGDPAEAGQEADA